VVMLRLLVSLAQFVTTKFELYGSNPVYNVYAYNFMLCSHDWAIFKRVSPVDKFQKKRIVSYFLSKDLPILETLKKIYIFFLTVVVIVKNMDDLPSTELTCY
jgi:hypothetical protein